MVRKHSLFLQAKDDDRGHATNGSRGSDGGKGRT
jgi:hypothetical protein